MCCCGGSHQGAEWSVHQSWPGWGPAGSLPLPRACWDLGERRRAPQRASAREAVCLSQTTANGFQSPWQPRECQEQSPCTQEHPDRLLSPPCTHGFRVPPSSHAKPFPPSAPALCSPGHWRGLNSRLCSLVRLHGAVSGCPLPNLPSSFAAPDHHSGLPGHPLGSPTAPSRPSPWCAPFSGLPSPPARGKLSTNTVCGKFTEESSFPHSIRCGLGLECQSRSR